MSLLLLFREGAGEPQEEVSRGGSLLLALNLATPIHPPAPQGSGGGRSAGGPRLRGTGHGGGLYFQQADGPNLIDMDLYDLEDDEELITAIITILFKTGVL